MREKIILILGIFIWFSADAEAKDPIRLISSPTLALNAGRGTQESYIQYDCESFDQSMMCARLHFIVNHYQTGKCEVELRLHKKFQFKRSSKDTFTANLPERVDTLVLNDLRIVKLISIEGEKSYEYSPVEQNDDSLLRGCLETSFAY